MEDLELKEIQTEIVDIIANLDREGRQFILVAARVAAISAELRKTDVA